MGTDSLGEMKLEICKEMKEASTITDGTIPHTLNISGYVSRLGDELNPFKYSQAE